MRRSTFVGSIAAYAAFGPLAARGATSTQAELIALETKTGGRLGVYALDTGTHATIAYREREFFPMCSTFKAVLVAAVLSRVFAGKESLSRRVSYTKADLLSYAPVTSKHVDEGTMTVNDLCAAAIEYSDNTAANLLLASIGGPYAYTDYCRTLGDRFTQLFRNEPSLNTAIPGDFRDTTTPSAMALDLQKLLLGNALSSASRDQLTQWMLDCKTGDARIRAGVPTGWRVADKTGSGQRNTSNDIAVIWPQSGAPIVLTVYLTNASVNSDARDAAIASVARIVAKEFTA